MIRVPMLGPFSTDREGATMRKATKEGWKLVGGKWTRSLGMRGARVRLFQRRSGTTFYRDVWVRGKGRDIKSLNTCDRDEAERLGKQLLGALLAGDRDG